MISLICPTSEEKTDKSVVRFTGVLTILTLLVHIYVQTWVIAVLLFVDYFIRAFLLNTKSPMSWVGKRVALYMDVPVIQMDKAPKIFASRVGFILATLILIFQFINPFVGFVLAFIFMIFNILDSFYDFCVGCFIYTVFVYPFFYKDKPGQMG